MLLHNVTVKAPGGRLDAVRGPEPKSPPWLATKAEVILNAFISYYIIFYTIRVYKYPYKYTVSLILDIIYVYT